MTDEGTFILRGLRRGSGDQAGRRPAAYYPPYRCFALTPHLSPAICPQRSTFVHSPKIANHIIVLAKKKKKKKKEGPNGKRKVGKAVDMDTVNYSPRPPPRFKEKRWARVAESNQTLLYKYSGKKM
jgi:hypothetical protein